MRWYQFALVLFIVTVSGENTDLSYVMTEKCTEGGQEYSACYSRQINELIQAIAPGKAEFGITTIDPFVTDTLNLSVNAGRDQFKMNFLKPEFFGFSKIRVAKLKVGNPLQLTLQSPKVKMVSPYVNSGRLILIQASGGGAMTNTFDDVILTANIAYETEQRNGKTYAKIKNVDVKFIPKKSNMHVDKLNSGNVIAQELYNVFLSASSNEILGLMLPQFNEKFSAIFSDIIRKVTENMPLESVFSS